MDDKNFMGFETETTTKTQIHSSTFAHHKISDVIFALCERPILFDNGIERIVVKPKYSDVKKSTKQSGNASKSAKESKTRSETSLEGEIITEQGIKISFGKNKVVTVPLGPML